LILVENRKSQFSEDVVHEKVIGRFPPQAGKPAYGRTSPPTGEQARLRAGKPAYGRTKPACGRTKPAYGGQACLPSGRVRVYTIFRNNALIIHEPSLHLSLTKGEKQWKHYF